MVINTTDINCPWETVSQMATDFDQSLFGQFLRGQKRTNGKLGNPNNWNRTSVHRQWRELYGSYKRVTSNSVSSPFGIITLVVRLQLSILFYFICWCCEKREWLLLCWSEMTAWWVRWAWYVEYVLAPTACDLSSWVCSPSSFLGACRSTLVMPSQPSSILYLRHWS